MGKGARARCVCAGACAMLLGLTANGRYGMEVDLDLCMEVEHTVRVRGSHHRRTAARGDMGVGVVMTEEAYGGVPTMKRRPQGMLWSASSKEGEDVGFCGC